MPSLDQLTASTVVKLLLIGDSGSGKTGSIASLVQAGYDVFLLDMDAGWESLAAAVKRNCPDRLASVNVETFRDKYKSSPMGPIMDGAPRAFISAIGLLDKWGDHGKPSTWGPSSILIIDSLTFLSDAAYAWADAMNPTAKDKRQIYGAAQEAVEHCLALLTGASFNTNVIITAHVKYMDLPDGSKKGYPTSIGQALSPTIPRYFNSVAACATQPGGKRTIQTVSTALMDLKNPNSFEMEKSLPIETGLATFFEKLRGAPNWTKKTSVTSTPSPTGMPISPTPAGSIQRITPKPSPISLK